MLKFVHQAPCYNLDFMKRRLASVLSLLFVATVVRPQEVPPDLPDSLKAPANEHLVLHAHAKGFQIYSCQAGADQKFAWTLTGPEADLFDAKGASVGKHYAGPTWKLNDGSEVTGKVAVKKEAPSGNAIPWLLLTVTGHSGSGILSHVATIQRLRTVGGLAPDASSCDESRKGTESKSEYSADYYFYAPAQQ